VFCEFFDMARIGQLLELVEKADGGGFEIRLGRIEGGKQCIDLNAGDAQIAVDPLSHPGFGCGNRHFSPVEKVYGYQDGHASGIRVRPDDPNGGAIGKRLMQNHRGVGCVVGAFVDQPSVFDARYDLPQFNEALAEAVIGVVTHDEAIGVDGILDVFAELAHGPLCSHA
jgi:hypothetical protein